MSKLKLPIIIAIVLAAAGAGLFFSGIVGGDKGAAKKYVVEPIPMAEPFIVNLADSDRTALLSINIALELEPMDEAHYNAFMGGGGHGGGEAPGPLKVATYPKFADAIITETSMMSSLQLLTEDGKAELKKRLLDRFNEIAERDTAELKRSASADDSEHVGPPYHVYDVQFTKYAVQTNG
jgi:flagellar basal body-associated protein FliL